MAAYQRSETTVHSLLFHVLAFSILLGNILYQHFNIITPATKIFPGRLKYLTYINEVLQMFYFLLAFINDVTLLFKKNSKTDKNNNDSKIIKLQDVIFAVVAFPLGMLVCVAFWSIYAVDRELIYPEIMDTIIPKICNHIMHTAVAIFLIFEAFIADHQFPRDKVSISGIFVIGLSYYIWMICQKYFLLQWPYPFLDHFTPFLHFLFVLISFSFLCLFYFLGKYFTKLRVKLASSFSNEKSNGKTN